MPYSSDEGKRWMTGHIWDALLNAPIRRAWDEPYNRMGPPALLPRLLDVGAGSGTYARLLAKPQMPGMAAHLTAVEIHAPYVARFGLRDLYDEVIVGDARTVPFPEADVVVLGDVLEHMKAVDATMLWMKARNAATTAVFLSLPIVPWPQGECEGNPHEAHVETWSHQRVLDVFDGITEWSVGEQVGVYRAAPSRIFS